MFTLRHIATMASCVNELVLLVLGAITGVIAQAIYTSGRAHGVKVWQVRRTRAARKGDDPQAQARTILDLYRERGLQNELFHTHTFGKPSPLPLLHGRQLAAFQRRSAQVVNAHTECSP